jgi:nitroreductase
MLQATVNQLNNPKKYAQQHKAWCFLMQRTENPTLKTIFQHRSIRKFKSRKIPRRLIELIVEAGQRAPTACGMQAYSFVLVTDSKVREQIFEVIGRQKCMEQTLTWVIICADMARQLELFKVLKVETKFGPLGKLIPSIIDSTLAAQNMVTAAEALGLGTVFIGSIWDSMKKIGEILKVPTNVLPIIILCLGYPDETPPQRPRWPMPAVLHENCYSMPSRDLMAEYYQKANKELVRMKYFSKGVNSWAEHWQRKFDPKYVKEWEHTLRKDMETMGFLPPYT